jgi:peptidoglycan/LPS O-acetylase OafA/YrhL
MSTSIAYRPDVDGLRAVAVLSVILCHFGVAGFRGGYVGVDVFFVISGFLITSIVLRDIATGSFSLGHFYERRARRILPVFLLVALVASLGSLILFLPADLLAFGKSLLASAVFSTNLLFWQEGGYFAAPSEMKPLLHTWSLSIEEQFYVFFPLLLSFASRRAPRRLKALLILSLIGSLALCVWATGRREFAFYSLPSRAWELMVGALLAVSGDRVRLSPRLQAVIGVAGLVGIAVCVGLYSNRTLFPGIAATLPCLAAAAIIVSGPDTGPAAWLLSRRPSVFIGKISYSLYLWHWPLLVFAKYYLVRPLSGAETVALLATTVVFSVISWRFVETPFRHPRIQGATRRGVLTRAAVGLLAVGLGGAWLVAGAGLPGRVPPEVLALVKAQTDRDRVKPACVAAILGQHEAVAPDCRLGATTQALSFVLWGDSHAAAASGAVSNEAATAGRAGVLLSMPGCPPLTDTNVTRGFGAYPECRKFVNRVMTYLESNEALQTVVIVSRWSVYIHGEPGGEGDPVAGPDPLLLDEQGHATTPDARAAVLERALRRTAERLQRKGKRVYVSDPLPEPGWDVPVTLARRAWFQPLMPISGPSRAAYLARNQLALSAIAPLARDGTIKELSPQDLLCGTAFCVLREGATLFYSDGNHVSRAGGLRIAPALRPAFHD